MRDRGRGVAVRHTDTERETDRDRDTYRQSQSHRRSITVLAPTGVLSTI